MQGGLDLLTALRADPRHARLPFILLSLFGAEHDTLPTAAHRPDAVALKPIRAAARTLVDQVLTGKPARANTVVARGSRQPTFPGHRILLVEDNPVNQRVAQRVLQNLAAEVTIANNGAEALERIAESAFRCRAHGLPDARHGRLHRDPPHSRTGESKRHQKRLPIIALTANVMSEDRESALPPAWTHTWANPSARQLADCLDRYLKQEPRRAEVDMAHCTNSPAAMPSSNANSSRPSSPAATNAWPRSSPRCSASDFETIGKRAHALKGASANIHAPRLSAAAVEPGERRAGESCRRDRRLGAELNEKLTR